MSTRKYTYYLSSIFTLLAGVRPWTRLLRVFLRLAPAGDHLIELPARRLRFKTRGVMDIWSVKETFLDRFYERFGTALGEGWTIVDIGGGIGDFTIFAAQAHPDNRVYAFEPTPQSYALLQENLRLNQVSNVQAYPEAIWSQTGNLAIDTSVGEPGQFISRQVKPGRSVDGKVVVTCLSMADAFARLGLERCDLLKIDCEGAEYPILFNCEDAALEKVERIIMEYHDNITTYTHQELEGFLAGKGFAVRSYPNFVHDYLGYLYAERISA